MTKSKMLAALLAAASPLLALGVEGAGSCEYTSESSAKDKLSYCTQVPDEARCKAAAAARATPAWLETHPAKFHPGGDCTDGGKALKGSGSKKSKAKAAKATP